MTDTITLPTSETGSPNPGAAAATPPAAAAPVSTTPAAAKPWYEGADEITTGYVQNKGWKNPLEAVSSYQNLEKLLGADRAGNTVVLPKPDAAPEEVSKFYEKLGRPADPKDYKIPVPDGVPKEFSESFRGKAHELGLTAKQVEGLAEWNNGFLKGAMESSEAAKAAEFQAQDQDLKKTWGSAFTQNVADAQAAARGLGLDAAAIQKIADGLGHKATMELFQRIGSKMGEAPFVTGDNPQGFGRVLTPAQAKAEIQTLKADKGFSAKYFAKDAEALARMNTLMAMAYPEEKG